MSDKPAAEAEVSRRLDDESSRFARQTDDCRWRAIVSSDADHAIFGWRTFDPLNNPWAGFVKRIARRQVNDHHLCGADDRKAHQ